MSNLIMAMIGVAFASALMLVGVSYLTPDHSLIMQQASASTNEVEQLMADYNALSINLGRRPTASDYSAVYNGRSQSTSYTIAGGQVSRAASMPGGQAGWIFQPGCGVAGGPKDCFTLTVDSTGNSNSGLGFAAAQMAAKQQIVNGTDSRLGLTTTTSYATAETNPRNWAPVTKYTLVAFAGDAGVRPLTYSLTQINYGACPPGCGLGAETLSSWSCTRSDGVDMGQDTTHCTAPPASRSCTTDNSTCTGTAVVDNSYCNPACGASSTTIASWHCRRDQDGADLGENTILCTTPASLTCTDYSLCVEAANYGGCTNSCGTGVQKLQSWTCGPAGNPTQYSSAQCLSFGQATPAATNAVSCTDTSGCPVPGVCGSDAGKPWNGGPWTLNNGGLCSVNGADTGVGSGNPQDPKTPGGNYVWTCAGLNGGAPATCTAPQLVNGVCGSDAGKPWNGGPWTLKPTGVCSQNGVDTYTGITNAADPTTSGGNYTWQCAGLNGGTLADCSAPQIVDGACGSDNGQPSNGGPWGIKPTGVCSQNGVDTYTGIANAADPTTAGGNYTWQCAGLNGGTTANCSAPQLVNAACGSDAGTTMANAPGYDWNGGTNPGPNWSHLCNQNGVDTGAGSGNPGSSFGQWTWDCAGLNGGTTAHCSSNAPVNGVCGSDNGQASNGGPWGIKPTGVCSQNGVDTYTGIANAADPTTAGGNYTWQCAGLNGGAPATCTAPQLVNGTCGSDNGTATIYGPWGASPDGVCTLNGVSSYASLTGATNPDAGGDYTWQCAGVNGGTTANCSAPELVTCGADQGGSFSVQPWFGASAGNLCNAAGQQTAATSANGYVDGASGLSSAVGSYWTWSCGYGSNQTSCYANIVKCGADNGWSYAVNSGGPTVVNPNGLCKNGTQQTSVYYDNNLGWDGNGHWTWSCGGVQCSANGINVGSDYGSNLPAAPWDPAYASHLCNVGGTDTATYAEKPQIYLSTNTFTWDCAGVPGWATFALTCGSDNGGSFNHAPWDANFPSVNSVCSVGGVDTILYMTNGALSGNTFTWNCGSSTCAANYDTATNEVPPASPPVTAASTPINASCGPLANVGHFNSHWGDPALCGSGTWAGDQGNSNETWSWTCNGANGGTNIYCITPQKMYGTCGTFTASNMGGSGSASGATTSGLVDDGSGLTLSYGATPDNNTSVGTWCAPGSEGRIASPTGLSDDGYQWIWTCTGDNGGSTVACSAGAGQGSNGSYQDVEENSSDSSGPGGGVGDGGGNGSD